MSLFFWIGYKGQWAHSAHGYAELVSSASNGSQKLSRGVADDFWTCRSQHMSCRWYSHTIITLFLQFSLNYLFLLRLQANSGTRFTPIGRSTLFSSLFALLLKSWIPVSKLSREPGIVWGYEWWLETDPPSRISTSRHVVNSAELIPVNRRQHILYQVTILSARLFLGTTPVYTLDLHSILHLY